MKTGRSVHEVPQSIFVKEINGFTGMMINPYVPRASYCADEANEFYQVPRTTYLVQFLREWSRRSPEAIFPMSGLEGLCWLTYQIKYLAVKFSVQVGGVPKCDVF